MLYRISVTERGLTGIANIFRSRLSRLDDLLGAGIVPLKPRTTEGGLDRVGLGAEIYSVRNGHYRPARVPGKG